MYVVITASSNVTYVRVQQTTNEHLNLVEVEMYYNNTKVPLSGTSSLLSLSHHRYHYDQYSIDSNYEFSIPRE
jgi:hypothetical protein